jgi:hypothetical protein
MTARIGRCEFITLLADAAAAWALMARAQQAGAKIVTIGILAIEPWCPSPGGGVGVCTGPDLEKQKEKDWKRFTLIRFSTVKKTMAAVLPSNGNAQPIQLNRNTPWAAL